MTKAAVKLQEQNSASYTASRPDLEFSAGTMDAAKVADAINTSGVALVRGALEKRGLEHIRLRAMRTFAIAEEQKFFGQMPEDYYSVYFRMGQIRTVDLPTQGEQPMMFMQYIFSQKHLEVLAAYHKENYSFLMRNTVVERQSPDEPNARAPYHQFAAMVERETPVLTSLMPLTAVGENSPTIEVLTENLDSVFTPETNDRRDYGSFYNHVNISDNTVEQKFGKPNLWRPVMEAGDLLLIKSTTITRTGFDNSMNKPSMFLAARSAKTHEIQKSAASTGLANISIHPNT